MDYRANNASDAFVNCRTLKSVWKFWYRFVFSRYISALCVYTHDFTITDYNYRLPYIFIYYIL